MGFNGKKTPLQLEGCFHIKSRVGVSLYMASEPPSPSGQGPLPRAVVETLILIATGAFHFMFRCFSYSPFSANYYSRMVKP